MPSAVIVCSQRLSALVCMLACVTACTWPQPACVKVCHERSSAELELLPHSICRTQSTERHANEILGTALSAWSTDSALVSMQGCRTRATRVAKTGRLNQSYQFLSSPLSYSIACEKALSARAWRSSSAVSRVAGLPAFNKLELAHASTEANGARVPVNAAPNRQVVTTIVHCFFYATLNANPRSAAACRC